MFVCSNINIKDFNCKITIVSCKTNAKEILKLKPHGIFLSNGPGDPAATGKYAIGTIKELIRKELDRKFEAPELSKEDEKKIEAELKKLGYI